MTKRDVLGKFRHRWEANIKMNVQIGCVDAEYIHLAENNAHWWGFVNIVMNHQVQKWC
jgi:hypothetical protein